MPPIARSCTSLVLLLVLTACGTPSPQVRAPLAPSTPTLPATHRAWEHVTTWTGGLLEFRDPQGVAVAADGQVYIADAANQRIQVFQPDGAFVTAWGAEGAGPGEFVGPYTGPTGITLSPAGDVYVVDSGGGHVHVFSRDGALLRSWGSSGDGPGQFQADSLFGATGIALDATGQVYVVDSGNRRVQVFTASGDFVRAWPTAVPGLHPGRPQWIAIHEERVYLTTAVPPRVQVHALDGRPLGQWGSAGDGPGQFAPLLGGIAVDSDEVIYVADTGRVQLFAADGTYLHAVVNGDTRLSGAAGLALGADRLYVADDHSYDIEVYAVRGSELAVAPTATLPPLAVSPSRTPIPLAPGAIRPENAAAIRPVATFGKGTVQAGAIAPDGHTVAIGSSTLVALYDAGASTPRAQVPVPLGVIDLVFAPDNQTLAAGLDDGTVLLIDARTGAVLHTIGEPGANPFDTVALAFAPDSTLLASASSATIMLWQVADGARLHTLDGHPTEVDALSFAADGRILLSVDSGLAGRHGDSVKAQAHLWDVLSGGSLRQIELPLSDISDVVAAPGAERFVTTSLYDGTILWQLEGTTARQVAVTDVNGFTAHVSADGAVLAVTTIEDTVQLYDGRAGDLRNLTDRPLADALALSSQGDHILAMGDGGPILEEVRSGATVTAFAGFSSAITAMVLSPDGTLALVGTQAGTLGLWDLTTGAPRWSIQAHPTSVSAVAFAPDGVSVASGSEFTLSIADFPRTALRVWSAHDGALLHALPGHSHQIYALAFSPDSAYLASSSFDATLQLWDVRSGAFVKKLADDESFGDLAWTPDGAYLLAAPAFVHGGDAVWFWDVRRGAFTPGIAQRDEGLFGSLALSADGTLLATSRDATVRVWTVADQTPLRELTLGDAAFSLALSPDARLVAAGRYDGKLELWDRATGRLVATLDAHTSYAYAVAFSPDGKRLISAGDDGALIVWEAP